VKIEKAILDKRVVVGRGTHIGFGDDFTPNQDKPDLLQSGITVIEKGAIIPSNLKIGRNCRIFRSANLDHEYVKSGSTCK
jgi:glucose-1-phosphate adenylyltransferase